MGKLLRLGRVDEDVRLGAAEREEFLRYYHHQHGFTPGELRFRDDTRNRWYDWEPVEGQPVRELTRFLQSAGFMPNASHGGIFGYATQAAVRLFQEYVRTVFAPERHAAAAPACWPDGVVGPDTRSYVEEWGMQETRCRWGNGETSADYHRWMRWLPRVARHAADSPGPLLQRLRAADRRGDTLLPEDWTFDPGDVHLVGIRRSADITPASGHRPPDDIFVLLVNGRTFYFWGSTDANPRSGREGYLLEAQHRYRLDWHNIGAKRRDRIYKAARPAGAGVMVARDVHGHDALTEDNRRDGFDPVPNPTFNIHWSGIGISNWSAGCQVINGAGYINDADELIDCSPYAARTTAERGQRRGPGGPRLTMGAYTLLSDLVLCYTPRPSLVEKPTFLYTLISETALGSLRPSPIDPERVVQRLRSLIA